MNQRPTVEVLDKNDLILITLVHTPKYLIVGENYAIVDHGMNNWQPFYYYVGFQRDRYVFIMEDPGPFRDKDECVMFTAEEMSDIIRLGHISTVA